MRFLIAIRTPSFSNAEAAGDVKRSTGGSSLLLLVEMGTAPPSVKGYDMLRPVIQFSHWHVHSDNCSCLIQQHSRVSQFTLNTCC